MTYKDYQRRINDIIEKCSIEAGVEILAFDMLYPFIKKVGTLIAVSSLSKKKAGRLRTEGGVPDLACVSKDFQFNGEKGEVFGFVEIKKPQKRIKTNTDQIKKLLLDKHHIMLTNGLVWMYYHEGEKKWEILLSGAEKETSKVKIDSKQFQDLMNKIQSIGWEK